MLLMTHSENPGRSRQPKKFWGLNKAEKTGQRGVILLGRGGQPVARVPCGRSGRRISNTEAERAWS